MMLSGAYGRWARRQSAEFDFSSISGLAVELDARDAAPGAIAALASRAGGYSFAGAATRNTALNGKPTIAMNGSTDILTSTAGIAELNGQKAFTLIAAMQDPTLTSLRCFASNGPGTSPGQFVFYWGSGFVWNFAKGDVGVSQYMIPRNPSLPAAVYGVQTDFALASHETDSFWVNGVQESSGGSPPSEANNTGTFGLARLSIGARIGGLYPSTMRFTKLCLYARALSAPEMLAASQAAMLLSGL